MLTTTIVKWYHMYVLANYHLLMRLLQFHLLLEDYNVTNQYYYQIKVQYYTNPQDLNCGRAYRLVDRVKLQDRDNVAYLAKFA